MRYVHRKKFVKLKNSRDYHSRSGDIDGQELVSFLRIVKEIVELVLIVIQVLRSLLCTVFRIRVDVAARR